MWDGLNRFSLALSHGLQNLPPRCVFCPKSHHLEKMIGQSLCICYGLLLKLKVGEMGWYVSLPQCMVINRKSK